MNTAVSPEPQDIAVLYAQHQSWLQSLLQRRLGNAFDACDLAQDVFVQLLRKPLCFDSAEGARAYMSRMAKGLCADLWRRRAVEQAWLDVLSSRPEPVEPSAEHRAIVIQTLCDIAAMLERLPEKAAAAFVMLHVHGMSYRDIASTLHVSDRMVRKYIAQAMLHCALLEQAG